MTEFMVGTHVGSGSRKSKPIKTKEGRRTCSDRGCQTILSMYNPAEWCFTHEPKKYVDPTRGIRRKHRPAGA